MEHTMFDNSREKVALFVDAGNLAFMQKQLNIRIDFDMFLKFFKTRRTTVVYAGYYTAVKQDRNGNRPLQPLLDFVGDHGYSLVTKPTKSYTQDDGIEIIKGNMDVELTCDVLELTEFVDRVILVTGDGDFSELVRRVIKQGVPVTIV